MGLKLLIAEDEDMIRNGMDKYIRLHTDRFEKIYLAKDGQEAIDIIVGHEPHIMLLDVQMPVKDGIEVMQEAKKMQLLPDTIILSGYDRFSYAQQALRYGAKEYMLKPSRSSDILEALYKVADEIEGETRKKEENQCTHYGVNKAIEYIKEHYSDNLTLQSVAEIVGISPGYLSSLFTQGIQCSFIDYVNQVRIDKACVYLEQNYFKTYEIAFKIGFHDEKYFSKVFKKLKGMSPSEYKKRKEEC